MPGQLQGGVEGAAGSASAISLLKQGRWKQNSIGQAEDYYIKCVCSGRYKLYALHCCQELIGQASSRGIGYRTCIV